MIFINLKCDIKHFYVMYQFLLLDLNINIISLLLQYELQQINFVIFKYSDRVK